MRKRETVMKYSEGYYPIVGEEIIGTCYCPECWETLDGVKTEDFEVANYTHETDHPVSCDNCHALIEVSLTIDGLRSVAEWLIFDDDGDKEFLAELRGTYGHEIIDLIQYR